MTIKLLGFALLSGILLIIAAPPLGGGPLVFFALIPWLYGLIKTTRQNSLSWGTAFLSGLCLGWPLMIFLFFWLIHHHPLALPLLASCLALPYGFLGIGIWLGIRSGFQGARLALWITGLWTATEFLVAHGIEQVPSCALGYALWKLPLLIQWADLAGVHGISLWIVSINTLIVLGWLDGGRRCRLWLGAVLVGSIFVLVYGVAVQKRDSADVPELRVAVVQTVVDTEKKTQRPTIEAVLVEQIDQTRAVVRDSRTCPGLVVWPETGVPVFLRSIDEAPVVKQLVDTSAQLQVPLLVGGLADESGVVFNAAYLVPPRGYMAQEYHKRVLVPFYETTPFAQDSTNQDRPEVVPSLGQGKQPGLVTLPTQEKGGIVICWEALYPPAVHELARQGAGFLINMTNDHAAFGDMTYAYRIPLAHLVFRAIECRRPLVRSANQGYSVGIDANGIIRASLPQGKVGALSIPVTPRTEQTVVVRWGNPWAWVLVFLMSLWGVMQVRQWCRGSGRSR